MTSIAKRIAEKWYTLPYDDAGGKREMFRERLGQIIDSELKPLLAVVEAADWFETKNGHEDFGDCGDSLFSAVRAYRAAQPQPQPATCWKCNGHGTLKTVAENWELCGCILDRLAKLEGKA